MSRPILIRATGRGGWRGDTFRAGFVHSYHVVPGPGAEDAVATTTDYGGEFVSSIRRDNLMATQFHPEKSQKVGLAMLANFAGL